MKLMLLSLGVTGGAAAQESYSSSSSEKRGDGCDVWFPWTKGQSDLHPINVW